MIVCLNQISSKSDQLWPVSNLFPSVKQLSLTDIFCFFQHLSNLRLLDPSLGRASAVRLIRQFQRAHRHTHQLPLGQQPPHPPLGRKGKTHFGIWRGCLRPALNCRVLFWLFFLSNWRYLSCAQKIILFYCFLRLTPIYNCSLSPTKGPFQLTGRSFVIKARRPF